MKGGSVAQAVRRSPLTAVIPVRVSVTPCEFRGERNGVWVGFLWVSPVFLCHKFESTFFSHIMSFISFHFISSAPVMERQA